MPRKQTVAQAIAAAVQALDNCAKSGNVQWEATWRGRLASLQDLLPSGSGFDNGTEIDLGANGGGKIVLRTAFHHMNDGGMYDGWTEHKITVVPDWEGISLSVSGRNRNDIKDYIGDTFAHCLGQFVEFDESGEALLPELREQLAAQHSV